MVFVLENPVLARLGRERMGVVFANMNKHKSLAWVCFFLGGLWSAQNIWYSSL